MKRNLIFVSFLIGAFYASAQNQKVGIKVAADYKPFATETEKKQWINDNPEKYAILSGQKQSSVPEFKNQAEKDAFFNSKGDKNSEFSNNNLKQQSNTTNQLDYNSSMFHKATPPVVITREEKEVWLKNNKELQYGRQFNNAKIHVSKDEFNKLPAGKKRAMLGDSNFIID